MKAPIAPTGAFGTVCCGPPTPIEGFLLALEGHCGAPSVFGNQQHHRTQLYCTRCPILSFRKDGAQELRQWRSTTPRRGGSPPFLFRRASHHESTHRSDGCFRHGVLRTSYTHRRVPSRTGRPLRCALSLRQSATSPNSALLYQVPAQVGRRERPVPRVAKAGG